MMWIIYLLPLSWGLNGSPKLKRWHDGRSKYMYVNGYNCRQYVSLWKVLYLQSELYDKLLAWLALQIAILSWYQQCQTATQCLAVSEPFTANGNTGAGFHSASHQITNILAMISAADLPPIAHVFSGPTLGRSTSNSSWGAARETPQGGWGPSLSYSMLLTEEGVCFRRYLSKTLSLNFSHHSLAVQGHF